MNAALLQFVQVVKRIPLFADLATEHVVALLKVCDRRTLEPREQLCAFGEASKDMFILLNGELSVRTEEGVQIAKISPIAPVGEMGFFTGETRSATVIASATSSLLVLSKVKLEMFMRRTPAIEIAISRSLISTLSQRIRTANQEIAHLQRLIADQGAPPKDLLEEEPET